MSAAPSSALPFRVSSGSALHWAIRALWVLATVAVVLYIPTKGQTGTIQDMTRALQLAIAAMSLNLVMGFGGIISLGHSAYFGFGGYVTAVLVEQYDWSQGWTFFAAAVLGFVVGGMTSLPALRLKGIYLALVTLGLAVVLPQLIKWQKATWLTDGARGIDDLAYDDVPKWPILGELERADGRATFMWWVSIIVLVLAYLVCRGVVKSRVGRSLVAIRDNETAAAVMGVDLARTKTVVFAISAAICAVGGSLFAVSGDLVNPDLPMFTLLGSIIFLLVMVLGGAATLWGPIAGAFLYVLVDTRARDLGDDPEGWVGWIYDRLFGWMSGSPASLILAVVLLVMMFVAPFGVTGLLKRLAARVVVVVPSPAGSGSTVQPVAGDDLDLSGPPVDPFDSISPGGDT